jgi:hypothetical protein
MNFRRRQRQDPVFGKVEKSLIGELFAVVIKIIGQSVQDKVVRAVLLGVVASVGSYTAIETGSGSPVQVEVEQKELPAIKLEPIHQPDKVEFPVAK